MIFLLRLDSGEFEDWDWFLKDCSPWEKRSWKLGPQIQSEAGDKKPWTIIRGGNESEDSWIGIEWESCIVVYVWRCLIKGSWRGIENWLMMIWREKDERRMGQEEVVSEKGWELKNQMFRDSLSTELVWADRVVILEAESLGMGI